jgi:hypothetical protein
MLLVTEKLDLIKCIIEQKGEKSKNVYSVNNEHSHPLNLKTIYNIQENKKQF